MLPVLLLLLYGLPAAIVAIVLWLLWRLARPRLPRWGAVGVVVAPLVLIVASEAVPARLAERIAYRSAHDAANSVAVDSVLFGSATLAAEAVAGEPRLLFAEGWNSGREEPVLQPLPRGRLRFSGVREKPDGATCRPQEVEEWVTTDLDRPPLRRCVGWRKVAAFGARYASFHNHFLSYRSGPYRITEQQQGVVRRSDGRAFNIYTNVEVTGGIWWHLVDLCGHLTGVAGFGHPGYASSTFVFIPRRSNVAFRYRGAAVQREAPPKRGPPSPDT